MSLSHPGLVLRRLEEIEADLAERQNEIEDAALNWFRAKRDREKEWADAFIRATGTVPERKARADLAVEGIGVEEEAKYEAMKAVTRVLETRASIGQSILRSQTREAYGSNSAVAPAWSSKGGQ